MNNARKAPWLGRFAKRLIADILTHISIASCAGTILFLVVDFVEVGNRARDTSAVSDFALLSAFSIPMILKLIMPVSATIGTFTAVGAQMRRLEIAAFFASGATPAALLKPLILAGLLVTALYATMVETLIPPSVTKTNVIRQLMGLPFANHLWGRNGWYKGKHHLYRVRALSRSDASELKDVLMLQIKNGKITDRNDIEFLRYEGGTWTGKNVVQRSLTNPNTEKTLDSPPASMTTKRSKKVTFNISERPRDFKTGLAIPKRLGYTALKESTEIRERLGRPALAHRLELYHRHTGPISLIIVILVAGALSLRNGRRQSLASAMGKGAALGFSLWLVHELATLVGATATIPAWGAAHILPFCLVIAAVLVWWMVESKGIRES